MNNAADLWIESNLFNLYISLKSNNVSLLNKMFHKAAEVADHYPEATWLSHVLPKGYIFCLKDIWDIVQLVPRFGVRMDD
jgi:hypothetical protein